MPGSCTVLGPKEVLLNDGRLLHSVITLLTPHVVMFIALTTDSFNKHTVTVLLQ
jgi:hypothetical protein